MLKTKTWKPGNGLLASLEPETCARLKSDLALVDLPVGKILFEPEATHSHIYFPRSGLVSLLTVLENGDTGEAAMVGNEGMVGVAMVVDSESLPMRAIVQVAGQALALKADLFAQEFRHGGEFQRAMLRYTQALIAQITQVSMCTRRHTLEKQFCRWLLLASDRVDGAEMPLTHETIAHLLGVRREGVTEAAGRLQTAELIRYTRGRIQVQDRDGLLARSCECYSAIKRETERLLESPTR